ncbi:MAG: hypothetical protein ACSHX9_03335 [Luteolibacter sp.]
MKLLTIPFLTLLLTAPLSADVGVFDVIHPEKATIQAFNAPQIVLTAEISNYPDKGHPDLTHRKEVDAENPEGYIAYYYKDRKLSWMGEPGGTYVSRFTLTWDEQEITIPDQCWNDLDRMRINLIKKEREPENEDEERELVTAHRNHDGPLVELSSDQQTVLITWIRREDGDTSSTFRWMISKDGKVLRHHQESPEI